MRNRFAGPCYRCGKRVDVGDGHFERFGGRWRVQHATCAIQYRGQPDPLRAQYQRARDDRLAQSTGKAAQNARRRIRDREKAESLARMKGNDMAMKGHVSVNEYAANYYFAGEGGDYTPTESERAMIEDAINGYLAEAGVVTAPKLPALDEIAKAISGVGYPEHVAGDGFAWWWHPRYDHPANVLTQESREEDREKARRVLALFDKPACQPPAAPTIDERDAFEAALSKETGIDPSRIRGWRIRDTYYAITPAASAFLGWKLARSKAVGETQEAFADGYVCGQGEGVEIARHAYEAHDHTNRDWVRDSLWDKLNLEGTARVEAARNRIGGQPLAASVDDLSNALKAIVNGAPDGMERGRAALARASRRRA